MQEVKDDADKSNRVSGGEKVWRHLKVTDVEEHVSVVIPTLPIRRQIHCRKIKYI